MPNDPGQGVLEEHVMGQSGDGPGLGPFMRVCLTVAGGVVRDASYETYFCPAAHDCGKAVCELVRGKTVEEARLVNRDAVAARVGPLPKPKMASYGLAVLALADALGKVAKVDEQNAG